MMLLLASNFIAVSANLICTFVPDGLFHLDIMKYVMMYIYYIFHGMAHFMTCIYTVVLISEVTFRKEMVKLISAIFGFDVIVLLSNIFTGRLFVFDAGGTYQRNWGMNFIYFLMELVVGISFLYAWKGRKTVSLRQWSALCCCLLSQLAGITLQIFFPKLLMEGFLLSAGMLVLGASAKNTEHVVNYETKALSGGAFPYRFEQKCLTGQPFCVILIYCKDWKFYSNAFGFEVGEFLLRAISHYLTKMFTEDDVFYFGDEVFGVIFQDYDHYGYQKYIHRIRKKFDTTWEVAGYHIRMEANFLGLRYMDDFTTKEEITSYIHALRNTAKTTELVVLKKDQLIVKDTERIHTIKKLLHKAVMEDGFDVYYQPIYSTHDKRIVSAEALVRLKDTKTIGFVSPEEFIPIAEQTGLIIPLGEIVFEKVCRFLKEHNLEEKGIEYIEVNLSTIQCMEDNLVKRLTAIMQSYGIRPEQINLEITETAKINSMEYVRKNMNYLKEKRISFSLDDYGSGNANLNYLLEFSFDIAKIDKFVLWNAFQNPQYMETLECTIEMLKKLGVRMVMEGVETEEQKKKLEELQCDYFQGYYFSRPLPDEQFVEYLDKSEYGAVAVG
jgi:EAL domain-containing protein (putative c-di-GMP-specific phosphodiesterase class I)/GGDEF domain-containing protein